MNTNSTLCMSMFLMYRYLYDETINFGLPYKNCDVTFPRTPIADGAELIEFLRAKIGAATADGKATLALSGGIDSAILARFMPPGSTAYTFRCRVPGKAVVDESERAAHYAELCGLKHKIIDIYWEDVEAVVDKLMLHEIYLRRKRGYYLWRYGRFACQGLAVRRIRRTVCLRSALQSATRAA